MVLLLAKDTEPTCHWDYIKVIFLKGKVTGCQEMSNDAKLVSDTIIMIVSSWLVCHLQLHWLPIHF